MRTFFVFIVLVFCCLAIGCKGFAYKVPTDSMKPAINVGDVCYANPFAYSDKAIERFDMVIFQSEELSLAHKSPKDTRYIKRVIGLPNEKIEIRNNRIYINDNLLEEPFESIVSENDSKENFSSIIIPNDEYFLLGDNRYYSEDSRYWKKPTISKENIFGKVIKIIHKDK